MASKSTKKSGSTNGGLTLTGAVIGSKVNARGDRQIRIKASGKHAQHFTVVGMKKAGAVIPEVVMGQIVTVRGTIAPQAGVTLHTQDLTVTYKDDNIVLVDANFNPVVTISPYDLFRASEIEA